MLEALKIQFERAVKEYADWRAVADHERSDAPAWWWGTAMDALGQQAAMPTGVVFDLRGPSRRFLCRRRIGAYGTDCSSDPFTLAKRVSPEVFVKEDQFVTRKVWVLENCISVREHHWADPSP